MMWQNAADRGSTRNPGAATDAPSPTPRPTDRGHQEILPSRSHPLRPPYPLVPSPSKAPDHIERENFAAPRQKQRTRSLWDSPGAGGGSGLTMPGPIHQCEEPDKASLRRAHGRGDRLDGLCVPEVSPDTGSIECTGSRLASRSRESATRANAARDSVRSVCSRAFAWRSRVISRRSS